MLNSREFPGIPGTSSRKLVGFTKWALTQKAQGENGGYQYWYHTHPFDKGAFVDGETLADQNNPSGTARGPLPWGDYGTSGRLQLDGILISKSQVVVFDSTDKIKCRFQR